MKLPVDTGVLDHAALASPLLPLVRVRTSPAMAGLPVVMVCVVQPVPLLPKPETLTRSGVTMLPVAARSTVPLGSRSDRRSGCRPSRRRSPRFVPRRSTLPWTSRDVNGPVDVQLDGRRGHARRRPVSVFVRRGVALRVDPHHDHVTRLGGLCQQRLLVGRQFAVWMFARGICTDWLLSPTPAPAVRVTVPPMMFAVVGALEELASGRRLIEGVD